MCGIVGFIDGKSPEYRKRKKFKRLIIAYLLRAIVILISIIMIILMVHGCLYLYDCFSKEDDKIGTFAGNDIEPPAPVVDQVPEFCVVVDAGHGGGDGGTVGGEVIEKDINLSMALKLKTILEDNNVEVILTRNSDEKMNLEQRTSVANDSNADFFISLHCNYYEGDAQIAGVECYYNSPDATESKAFAESIINAISLSDEIIAKGIRDESFYVLKNTKMPAVLVEMGFLSNYSDRQKLSNDDYQEILAQKIAEGILTERRNFMSIDSLRGREE